MDQERVLIDEQQVLLKQLRAARHEYDLRRVEECFLCGNKMSVPDIEMNQVQILVGVEAREDPRVRLPYPSRQAYHHQCAICWLDRSGVKSCSTCQQQASKEPFDQVFGEKVEGQG